MDEIISDEANMERAISLSREYLHAIKLQRSRIENDHSDYSFVMRQWVDYQFFILALYRFRNMVTIARKIPNVESRINTAIEKFDKILPDLQTFRDIGEHMADYAVDKRTRHVKTLNRKHIQVGIFGKDELIWLDRKLNLIDAENAATELYRTLQTIKDEVYNQNSVT